MNPNMKEALDIRKTAMDHNKFFEESIPLIASENLMSPLAMEMLLTDFGFRYAEGLPHHRYYQGNFFVHKCLVLFVQSFLVCAITIWFIA